MVQNDMPQSYFKSPLKNLIYCFLKQCIPESPAFFEVNAWFALQNRPIVTALTFERPKEAIDTGQETGISSIDSYNLQM